MCDVYREVHRITQGDVAMTEPPPNTPNPSPAESSAITHRKPRRRLRRWLWISAGVVVVLFALAAVLGRNAPPQATNTAAQPTPTKTLVPTRNPTTSHPGATVRTTTVSTTTVRATTTNPPPAPHLTGYGATIADWDSAHTPDPDFDAGSTYGADPSLPPVNGHTGAKYTAVQPLGGRVTDYYVNFLPISLAGAEQIISAEFPSDMRILWTSHVDTCVQVEYASTLVHAATGNTQVGDALVEYGDIQPDGSSAPSPTTFNQALISDLPGAQPDPSATC